MSRIATFGAADKPVIFWTPDFGAVIVRGAMNAAWDKLGRSGGGTGRAHCGSERERRRHHAEVQWWCDLLGQEDQEVQHRTRQSRVELSGIWRCPGQRRAGGAAGGSGAVQCQRR